MSKTSTQPPQSDEESRPTTAAGLVEKHGRDTLEALAEDGNIAAQVALDIVDETEEDDAA